MGDFLTIKTFLPLNCSKMSFVGDFLGLNFYYNVTTAVYTYDCFVKRWYMIV